MIPLETGAGAVVVATPLREIDQTLDRLVVVEAIVVAAVLLALLGIGWGVIRIALRPLDQMSSVANETPCVAAAVIVCSLLPDEHEFRLIVPM